MMRLRPCSDSWTQRRPRPRLRLALAAPVALAAFLATAAVGPALASEGRRDAALAASLVRGARDALALGYADAAEDLVAEALSFAPDDSDALYLSALLAVSGGDALREALDAVSAALAADSFSHYRRDEARLLLASLLARTGRPAEAIELVGSLPRSAESLYAETLARLELGDAEGASRAVVASLGRYPADARPAVAFLSRAASAGWPPESTDTVVAAARDALSLTRETAPELLPLLARFAPSTDEARLLVREYRAAGHRSAGATVLSLRLGLVPEEKAIGELLSGGVIPSRAALEDLYALLASDESRAYFARAFKSFSGAVHDEPGPDGRPAAVTLYADGLPVRWASDDDRDGVPELELSFEAGEPRGLARRGGTGELIIRYASWPYVERATFRDRGGARSYGFAPRALAYGPLRFKGFPGLGREPYLVLREESRAITETLAVSLAYVASEGDSRTETLLSEGIPYRSFSRDPWGGSVATRYGSAPYKVESLDLDGDGRFEARRSWSLGPDGSPGEPYTEYDGDGDGLFEYREATGDGVALKAWDYDADGSVDLTLETLGAATLRYRFIGRGRGRGAVEAVFEDGRLRSVEEDGRGLPLVPERGGLVVWIGRKAFDFGSVRPRDGYGLRNGVAYRVLTVAGVSYVQALD